MDSSWNYKILQKSYASLHILAKCTELLKIHRQIWSSKTHIDKGKWLELNPGAQRNIAYRTWYFDCRLNVNNNNNNNNLTGFMLLLFTLSYLEHFGFLYPVLTQKAILEWEIRTSGDFLISMFVTLCVLFNKWYSLNRRMGTHKNLNYLEISVFI